MSTDHYQHTYLHIDFVVFSEDEISTSERSDECEDGVVPARQLAKQQRDHLVDGCEESKVASVLKRGLQDEFKLLLQTAKITSVTA